MLLREYTEEKERETLSPFATLSANSKGRRIPEEKCPIRTDFQRDRDRIIHSKAFRRLMHKTQVFIAPEGDHYRTRLTHTLEVAQIARTIGRALKLNEDLIEAISLGHDLGHTPFGHAGEEVLDELIKKYIPSARFRHNEQGLRVVDYLEKEGKGLNLTYEVRDGILHHSKGMDELGSVLQQNIVSTLEGKVVMVADRIAYLNHDLDDALRAGIIREEDIPKDYKLLIGETHSQRINRMVRDVIEHSQGKPNLHFSREVREGMEMIKEFLQRRVYKHPLVLQELDKAKRMLRDLFLFYMENPHLLPPTFQPTEPKQESLARSVCDFIAGMTDHYAFKMYSLYFLPKGWQGL